MNAKKLVQAFYKSDALIDPSVMQEYLHPEFQVEWNSTKGLIRMDYQEILDFTAELNKAYVRTKARISHILQDGDLVSVRYSHYVKTIENPREEMLMAHFFAIWEIKDDKLYRCYQMSQLS